MVLPGEPAWLLYCASLKLSKFVSHSLYWPLDAVVASNGASSVAAWLAQPVLMAMLLCEHDAPPAPRQ